MFAISFDMTVSELEACYGKPYNRTYYVRDIRAYKVEDWSDFTQIVKNA